MTTPVKTKKMHAKTPHDGKMVRDAVVSTEFDRETGRMEFRVPAEGWNGGFVEARCDDRSDYVPLMREGDAYVSSAGLEFCSDGSVPEASCQLFADPRYEFVERDVAVPLTVKENVERYFSRRSRIDGERDLKQLSQQASSREGVFFFVEGLLSGGAVGATWYAIDHGGTPTATAATYTSSFARGALSLFERILGVSSYHFHPIVDRRDPETRFPSPQDYASLIAKVLRPDFDMTGIPEGLYDQRIVTDLGVFILTPNICKLRDDPGLIRLMHDRYRINYYVTQMRLMHRGGQVTSEDCERFASQVTNDLVHIRFQPF